MRRLFANARTTTNYHVRPDVLVEVMENRSDGNRWHTLWLWTVTLHPEYGTWSMSGSAWDPNAENEKGKWVAIPNVNMRTVDFIADDVPTLCCAECGKRLNDNGTHSDGAAAVALCASVGHIQFCATREPF